MSEITPSPTFCANCGTAMREGVSLTAFEHNLRNLTGIRPYKA